MLEISSTIRGYHVYKRRWSAILGEILQAQKEPTNVHDRYAVTLIKERVGIVGHVPKFSKLCHSFLTQGGTIEAVVMGVRHFADDLPQGLDVPCKYIFSGNKELLQRLKKALARI